MVGNRWILMGCATGLTVILAGLVAGVYSMYWITHQFNDWINDMEQLQSRMETLNQDYPFSIPESIDPRRYQIFLQVRDEMIQKTKEELDWFYSFVNTQEPNERISFFPFMGKLISLIPALGKIGIEQCKVLDQVHMSPREYRFYTAISAGETLIWLELETQTERRKMAEAYWSWMNHMHQSIQEHQSEKIPMKINVGPFDLEQYKAQINQRYPSDRSYDEILWQHRGAFFESPFAIFIDAFTLSQLFEITSDE